MEIRFVKPEEVRQLQRNVVTGFPSKTPPELLKNMPEELVSPQLPRRGLRGSRPDLQYADGLSA